MKSRTNNEGKNYNSTSPSDVFLAAVRTLTSKPILTNHCCFMSPMKLTLIDMCRLQTTCQLCLAT